jgi:flagellar hook-associated protein 3 FlgL
LPLGDGQSVTRGLTGPEFLNFTGPAGATNLFAVVNTLRDALNGAAADPAQAARDALAPLDTGLETLTTQQTVIGARLNWIDLNTERRTQMSQQRSDEEASVGGTDLSLAVSQLQQTMTVLEASQASFAKLAQLSLFDLLR